jgi:hypothetical protein
MSAHTAAPSVPFVNEPEHFNVDFSPSGAWTFPVPQQPVQQVSFPYPNTPATAPNFAQPVPGVPGLNDFAGQNDLGFVTLDGWFNQDQPDPPGFADLDLQDFWMKVGPGEVGAAYRHLLTIRRREGFHSDDDVTFSLAARQIFLYPRERCCFPP